MNDISSPTEPPASAARSRAGGYFAWARVAFALVTLATLVFPVTYLVHSETHVALFVAHGGPHEPWTETSALTFWEAVEQRPDEGAWICLPFIAIALAAWERYDVRQRRRHDAVPSRIGAVARLFFYLTALMGLISTTFQLDLFDTWSDGPAKGMVDLCGLLALVAVVIDLVAVSRERGRAIAAGRSATARPA